MSTLAEHRLGAGAAPGDPARRRRPRRVRPAPPDPGRPQGPRRLGARAEAGEAVQGACRSCPTTICPTRSRPIATSSARAAAPGASTRSAASRATSPGGPSCATRWSRGRLAAHALHRRHLPEPGRPSSGFTGTALRAGGGQRALPLPRDGELAEGDRRLRILAERGGRRRSGWGRETSYALDLTVHLEDMSQLRPRRGRHRHGHPRRGQRRLRDHRARAPAALARRRGRAHRLLGRRADGDGGGRGGRPVPAPAPAGGQPPAAQPGLSVRRRALGGLALAMAGGGDLGDGDGPGGARAARGADRRSTCSRGSSPCPCAPRRRPSRCGRSGAPGGLGPSDQAFVALLRYDARRLRAGPRAARRGGAREAGRPRRGAALARRGRAGARPGRARGGPARAGRGGGAARDALLRGRAVSTGSPCRCGTGGTCSWRWARV